jgi:hypothetical protein
MSRAPESIRARVAAGLLFALTLAFCPAAAAAPGGPSDTLDVHTILARRSARLDSLLRPESVVGPDPALRSRIEDLDAGGAGALAALSPPRRGLRVSVVPGRFSAYNRVEGSRPGVGLDLSPRRGLRLRADGGYAIEPHRWVGEAVVSVGATRRGPALHLLAGDRFVPFGPTPDASGEDVLSLVAGQDRRDYLRRRGAGVALDLVRAPSGRLGVGAFYREDLRARAGVSGHLFGGGTPIEAGNPEVDRAVVRGVRGHLARSWRGDEVQIRAEAGLAEGDFDFAWQEGSVILRPILPDGGILHVGIEGRAVAGRPPAQDEAFLGGDANLRGYDRLEFTGRRRLSARVEYEMGVDLLRRSGIPVLRSLDIQFIPFVDAGTTWGVGRGLEPTRESLEGRLRSSFGVGLRRDVWLPGVRAVRLDVHRRADGSGDTGAWFRLIPYEFE